MPEVTTKIVVTMVIALINGLANGLRLYSRLYINVFTDFFVSGGILFSCFLLSFDRKKAENKSKRQFII